MRGEEVELAVRVVEVAFRCAKELPKGSKWALSANVSEEKGVDGVVVNVFALGEEREASAFARCEVREGHVGAVGEGEFKCAKYTLFVRGVG